MDINDMPKLPAQEESQEVPQEEFDVEIDQELLDALSLLDDVSKFFELLEGEKFRQIVTRATYRRYLSLQGQIANFLDAMEDVENDTPKETLEALVNAIIDGREVKE